ncbi:MAG TPA: hypothetical protein VKB46_07935 [Pyrinomonadaceae bacterium]|nr:hypothetical protein [Pyrinomonadaceae bacterium]
MEINVKNLKANDEISIRTQHSEYKFCVTNPALCRGLLSGGLLGDEQYDAVLTGAAGPDDLQTRITGELEIGGSALFFVAARESMKCLTTSTIHDLELALVPDEDFTSVGC